MMGQIIIDYQWWRQVSMEKGVCPGHTNLLRGEALDTACSLGAQGYMNGSLYHKVDGVRYSGWWEVSKV